MSASYNQNDPQYWQAQIARERQRIAVAEGHIRRKEEQQRAERQRQVDAERALEARRQVMREEESYSTTPGRTHGMFDRYRVYDPDRRTIIEQAVEHLMPRRFGEEYHRRPYPVWERLSTDGKWATLGAYLRINAVRDEYPRMVFDPEDWLHNRVSFRTVNGLADLNEWRQHLPGIRDYINPKLDFSVRLGASPNIVVVTYQQPLAAELAFDRCWHVPGHLFVGLDTSSHQPISVPFADLTSTLVVGTAGFGKTNAMHGFIQSFLRSHEELDAIYLIDGKSGVGFNRYADVHPKVTVLWQADDVAALMQRLIALMQSRNDAQREAGIDNATTGFIPVIIDELPAYIEPPSGDDKAEKQRHKQMVANIIALASRGRSVGIRLMVSVQTPNDTSLPVNVRANINTVLCFRLPIQQHVNSVFGAIDGLPVAPNRLLRGEAIYQNNLNGLQCQVKLPIVRAGKISMADIVIDDGPLAAPADAPSAKVRS